MSKLVNFTKMHALGNDFVILDRINQSFYLNQQLIQRISDRHFGVGCDQVLVVEAPHQPEYDFFYRIFNANGHEVAQCGNGARCIARYVFDQGLTTKKHLKFGTEAGLLEVNLENPKHIAATLVTPQFDPKNVPTLLTPENDYYTIPFKDTTLKCQAVSLGNPHCLLKVSSLETTDVTGIGQHFQNLEAFPQKANVTFIETLARNHLRCRVFERDVGETLACGSAACAAVVCGIRANELSHEVRVDMPGGHVTVIWEQDAPVQLIGPVSAVYQGQLLLTR